MFDEWRDDVYEDYYTYNYNAGYPSGITISYTTGDKFLVNHEDNVFSFLYEDYYYFFSPYFIVVDDSNNQYKLTKGNISLSGFNDDLTYDAYGDWNLFSNGTARLDVNSAGNVGFDSLNGISITWDGSRDLQFGLTTLTGNWNAGNYDISSETFTSTVSSGTASRLNSKILLMFGGHSPSYSL